MTTETQMDALIIVPKISAALSVLGSCIIIGDLMRRRFYLKNKTRTRHRLILGMGFYDLCSSLAWFVASWPVPADFPGGPKWKSGTWGTCEAQGFFVQFCTFAFLWMLAVCSSYCSLLTHFQYISHKQRWEQSHTTQRFPCTTFWLFTKDFQKKRFQVLTSPIFT